MAFFAYSIFNVIRVGTRKEMIRINTSRRVTGMTDVVIGGYRPFMYSVTDTVCENPTAPAHRDEAIPGRQVRASPKPALISLCYLIPETCRRVGDRIRARHEFYPFDVIAAIVAFVYIRVKRQLVQNWTFSGRA